ncbi:MAG: glycosyltransferase family 39 protein [Rhizomicrobium sp.]
MRATAQSFGFRLVTAALAVGCVLGLVHVVSVVGVQVPFDPNEGWNAYFSQLAMATGTPYPPEGSLLINNYPPLSFFIVGELGRLVGDAIVAGRIVSLMALVAGAFGIATALWRMGCTPTQSLFAALFFIACLFLTSDYVCMNDPQLLGHAIAIWGLVVALRAPRIPRDVVFAALLLTIAFFVKHNLILLPISLASWLMLVDRRHALTFIASGMIFVLVGLGIFRDIFGTSFVHQIVSARIYSFEYVRTNSQNWLPWAAVPLCGALLLFRVGRRDQFAVFAIIYVAVSTVGAVLFSGGAGVDANAFFDADIALVLCAGLLLDRLENKSWATLIAVFYVAPLLFLLQGASGDWKSHDYWLHPMGEDRRVASSEIALLRISPDPVLCEMLSLCYWAKKSPQVDVFNMDQRFRTGAQSAAELVRQIDEKRFSILQLETLKPFPFPLDVERAVMRSYKIVRTDDERVFLAPR